ncbi:MAG TPA: ferredoxin family protein [Thermoguttaceae bacterium]|nr:ferredoxin family protein [Thermoguttaceae bacterium]
MADRDDYHLILCRARQSAVTDSPDAKHRAFEEELLALLTSDGRTTLTVAPHLIDLTPDGLAIRRLRSLDGNLIVLSWLPARATYWLLRAAGIEGHRESETPAVGTRRLLCLDLRKYPDPAACVEAICRIMSAAQLPATEGGKPAEAELLDESTQPRWYPVIDYDRCVNCLECLNFCLFGVYDLDASEAVFVDQPDACRPGCPACARVCPSGAIMFPEYADPAISGDATDETKPPSDKSNKPSDRLSTLDRLVDEVDDLDV